MLKVSKNMNIMAAKINIQMEIEKFYKLYLLTEDGRLKNNIVKVENPDGSSYIGEIKGRVKYGRGVLIYKNGDRYIGGWKDDVY